MKGILMPGHWCPLYSHLLRKKVKSCKLTLYLCLEIGYLFKVTANPLYIYLPTGRLLVGSEQDWTKEKEDIV